jgi:tetratricopeptide (TPR) repeat protein
LPVSWYAENGGAWAMSPGYDRADHQDFRWAIGNDGMSCHNGYPAGETADADERVFSGRIPEGIDCQRCHGPGRAHAESKGAPRTIVNPARLDRDRQLDVCMQCHLETISLALPNAIRHYDRGPYSFQAGEALGNYATFFDHAPGTGFDDRFEVAHAAYRLRKSACFRESRMTCTTCHDPHQEQLGKQAEEHYIAVCKTCHGVAHASGAPVGRGNCLDCHMPKRRTEDVVHVVMTDHYIQRRKPDRDLLASLSEAETIPRNAYHGQVVVYYPGQKPDDLYVALAQVRNGSNQDAGIAALKSAIERNPAVQSGVFLRAGRGLRVRRKSGRSGPLDEALRRRPNYGAALAKLAATLTSSGRLTRAAAAGERAIATQPANPIVLTNLANAYLQLGRTDRARLTPGQVLKINADLPEAQNLLGLATLRKGDRAAAESRFREAIRIQPDSAEAHNNLAKLIRESGDYAQSAYHFQKAIAANGNYAEPHHGFGMLFILTRSYQKARVELEEAVRLDPRAPRKCTSISRIFWARRGGGTTPRMNTGAAIQLNPESYEAHLALGILLLRSGAKAEAGIHLRKAAESSDPQVRQAALHALR